jgi:hypothetical protein
MYGGTVTEKDLKPESSGLRQAWDERVSGLNAIRTRDFRIVRIGLTCYEWEILTRRLREINAENPAQQIQAGRMFWMVVAAIEASWQCAESDATFTEGGGI